MKSLKKIYLNLKRFDIPKEYGGVNNLASVNEWGNYIISSTKDRLKTFEDKAEFTMFFPEAHILNAVSALGQDPIIKIGCQSIYREDTGIGGNFGAFTSNLTANAAKSLGCTSVLIGHCEERKDKLGILNELCMEDKSHINKIFKNQISCALDSGLQVLYCIGETAEEQDDWKNVLRTQLELALSGLDTKNITIAYEPVWAIGPMKTPPDSKYIKKIASYIKEVTGGLSVVYGGGLKKDNAEEISKIPEIDGGLIALTRFSGDIGFYPDEYIEIIKNYMGGE